MLVDDSITELYVSNNEAWCSIFGISSYNFIKITVAYLHLQIKTFISQIQLALVVITSLTR